jgi:hypothetical protein
MEEDLEVQLVEAPSEREEEPTQKFEGEWYPVGKLLTRLKALKAASKQWYWKRLTPEIMGEESERRVVLACDSCSKALTISNPTQTANSHLIKEGGCVKSRSQESSKRARGVEEHFVRRASVAVQDSVHSKLALFFYKNNVALHLIESEDLVAAFDSAGITLPSRKVLSTSLLDKASSKMEQERDAVLASMRHVQLSTDGWSSQACMGGAALINCMVLLPDGGSYFLDVINASGQKKDKAWVCRIHLALLDQATNGDKSRQNCIIMDNTKANRGGMDLILLERPMVITLGCQVNTTQHTPHTHTLMH